MPIRLLSPFLIALAAMLWGSDLLLRPGALSSGWSPAWVVLGEHLILSVLFVPLLWRERHTLARLDRTHWGALLFVAWGGSAVATWLYTKAFALDFSHALTVVLLQKTQPVIAILLAGLLLGERRSPLFWFWGAGALAGAYLLIGFQKSPSLADVHAKQALLALGAAALWGASTVAGRSLTAQLSPGCLAGARFTLAVPVLSLLLLVPPGTLPTATHSASHAALFLLLIVLLPDLAGMALYYLGLRGTTASVATLAELCYPLTSLLLGVFVLHTPTTPGQWVGFVLLLAAVLGLGRKPGVAAPAEKNIFNAGTGGYDGRKLSRMREGINSSRWGDTSFGRQESHPVTILSSAGRISQSERDLSPRESKSAHRTNSELKETHTMASEYSFDTVSKADPQEVKNAIQQAQREIETRFDFRGSVSEIDHDGKDKITLTSDDETRLTALIDVLQSKLIKRGVDIKFLDYGKLEQASKGTVRQVVTVKNGLPTETARKIVKLIKDKGLKVTTQIQDEQVRVTGKSKDSLQEAMTELKAADLDVPLQFTNYR